MLETVKRIYRKLVGAKPYISQPNKEEVLVDYEVKRKVLNDYRLQYQLDVFVETGTFLGDTIHFFKDRFSRLYSIELSEELAARAVKRFAADSNVTIIQGDSGRVFETLIPSIKEPALFWLDGHYSSEFFHDGEYIVTAKAELNTPVEKELDILLNSPHKNVILIDDARLFVGAVDYPTIDAIQKKVASHPYKMKVENDMIQITPVN